MSIEQSLERIATALEKLAFNVSTTQPIPQEETVTVKAKQATLVEYTDDDVRKAVKLFMAKNGQQETEALIVKFGAKADKPRLSDVKDRNGLVNAIQKAMGE